MTPWRWLGALILAVVALGLFYRLRLSSIPGTIITSWWRSPWHNTEVGGVPNSRHLLGLAFDVAPATPRVIAELEGMGFALVLNERNHVHVEII